MKRPIICHRERCLGYGRMEECYSSPETCRVKREFQHFYSDDDLERWNEIIAMEHEERPDRRV